MGKVHGITRQVSYPTASQYNHDVRTSVYKNTGMLSPGYFSLERVKEFYKKVDLFIITQDLAYKFIYMYMVIYREGNRKT